MDKDEIIKKVRSNGVVGAGGAGFPTYVKLSSCAEYLIVNGAECEPLLQSDKFLIHLYLHNILEGLQIEKELINANKAIFAIKSKNKDLVARLKKKLDGSFEIFELPDYYPEGDEQILTYDVLGRIVPEAGLPLNAGVIVQNVGTLFNIYRAVKQDKPVTFRFVTVCGEVNSPFVAPVAIGTKVTDLIKFAGGVTTSDYAIIEGGPMMGDIVDEDFAITKTTTGIIVLPRSNKVVKLLNLKLSYVIRQAQSVCGQCRYCTDQCPRYLLGHNLEPHKIMRSLSILNPVLQTTAFLCSECGLCDLYSCPMGLSPRLVNRYIKNVLNENGIKNPHNELPTASREFNDIRRVPIPRLMVKLELDKYKNEMNYYDKLIIPDVVFISLKQHIGEKAEPIVKVNDKVKSGQKIGKVAPESLGADIHSSLNGTVTQITNDYIKIETNL
jgi:RnfABCDGE-type electron transport complex C subunit